MAPRPSARTRDERGYIAVTTGLILIVLMSFSAFAVDVGNWYLTGQRAQRAADAAALAGVVKLPGNQTAAFSMAQSYSANNGFTNGSASTVVSPALSGGPTRLRVDVSRTVNNLFGPLLGRPTTTISRYAVADYAGPVPLGSPCNRFGDDPLPAGDRQHQLRQHGPVLGQRRQPRRVQGQRRRLPERHVHDRGRLQRRQQHGLRRAVATSSPSPCASR